MCLFIYLSLFKINLCIICLFIYLKLDPDVHVYTHMCIQTHIYIYIYNILLVMYMQINPIYMAYLNSDNFGGHRLLYKIHTRSHEAWYVYGSALHDNIANGQQNSQFHNLSFVDRVCHTGFSNLLVHGTWHMLILFSFAAQCLVSGFPYVSFMCLSPPWHVYVVCSISLLILPIALSAPQRMPKYMRERMPHRMPDFMPDRLPNYIPDKMLEDMPDRISE